jgi:hypothetical protein
VGLRKVWRVLEVGLEANPPTFLLKVEESPNLWPEESVLACNRVGLQLSFGIDSVAADRRLEQ